MKDFFKLSALAAVLVASATFASADTLVLGSYGTGQSPLGNANTAMNYAGYQPVSIAPSSGTGNSFFLDPSTPVWNAAVANSTWVGYASTAGPVGTVNPAFGYYTFTTTFTAGSTGLYSGSLTVQADDTTEVLLNGTPIVFLGALGGDSHCADNLPTCSAVDTVTISNVALLSGSNANKLTFVVEQMGVGPTGGTGDPSGVDFDATLTAGSPVPEPSTLLMLGTGLMGSAGALYRRVRS